MDIVKYDFGDSLEKEWEELRKEYNNMRDQYVSLENKIQGTLKIISGENEKYESMYEELLEEVYQMEKERGFGKEKPEKVKPKPDIDSKTIYRKISTLCHPDKTDDKKMHEMYIEAKKAYERGDKDHLSYLYGVIISDDVDKNVDVLQEMRDAISSTKKKISEQLQEYMSLKGSVEYLIYKKYNSGLFSEEIDARRMYTDMLLRKIETQAKKKESMMCDS